jgi:hypothetical protein
MRMPGNRLTAFMRAVEAAVMTSRISHTSFDAIDAYAQSVFWSKVLGFTEDPDDPNEPGHEECLITSRDRSQLLLFITVPDRKKIKNRMHLDLRPEDGNREQEAERILALGASHLADHRRPDGSGWITLADPEGNEFCILSKDPASSGATT